MHKGGKVFQTFNEPWPIHSNQVLEVVMTTISYSPLPLKEYFQISQIQLHFMSV